MTDISKLQVSGKLADNERIKGDSDLLRGTIAEDLTDTLTGGFTSDNFQLIRFHGMYQQDDRDIRQERTEQKLEPLHTVMLRARMPGGVITPKQWLAIDEFAESHTGAGSIRLTTRQTFQFHGVLKRDIKLMHQTLDKIGIDSIATAGDVNRNVLCTSNPEQSELHSQAYEWAKTISEHLLPRTRAYAEIWLDGEKVETTERDEPILGKTYLPRKFKTTVVVPPQNDVDLHANDMNFVAIADNGQLVGFNLLVGGGLAMTHGDEATYPRKADEFGYLPLDKTLAIAEAVVTTQRDLGNRVNRKNAKTKYTLDRVGLEVFKAEVERRAGFQFEPTRPYELTGRGDAFGWTAGIDGKHNLTLFIENGRLLDYPGKPLKSGMARIARQHKGEFRMTANQNLVVAGVASEDKAAIEQLAREHGLFDEGVSNQRKSSMACVSLPTCPLAMAEAERFLPDFVTRIEGVLAGHGIADDAIIFRVTGCPNGCGRAMLAEVGLVGKGPGKYNLHLGGNLAGTRVPKLYKENLDEDAILAELDNLSGRWARERLDGEGFGDFVIRIGIVPEVIVSRTDFYA
ncbi:assimilatory sulfite reductase (NADPH) hemoprotein subunit [Ferrimonas sp. SCSIO 43195]|uniref:assimilatory sulfite reductase (NADPH) hemoprotein subunit n=1 Tax=Ferrimonas sp. SCSIO 43195 TaxID=2822844 RepID=UPI002075ABEC|nr:assimilatory sulfite reductase (NADPH) hemoprotein subunit [Ferrimonas sp. SCSIO 43195]USD37007.1 assimilatory sulfite reductase (NADPH) hemoprotein subunit [Ferrimonas sp. SCSIO 43195]